MVLRAEPGLWLADVSPEIQRRLFGGFLVDRSAGGAREAASATGSQRLSAQLALVYGPPTALLPFFFSLLFGAFVLRPLSCPVRLCAPGEIFALLLPAFLFFFF